LLDRSRPPTVTGLVVAVVVDAIDGAAVGSLAHVGEEVGEGVPALADGDPSSAVVGPVLASGVVAALEHGLPDSVAASALASMFRPKTPAAEDSSGGEVVRRCDVFAAAVASTEPGSVPLGSSKPLDSDEATESLTFEV
jgi:hypothetical protein